MKYINTLSIILGVAFLSSCTKHEVIPAPEYEAKLPVSFNGDIQGANYEIIKDIKGFFHETSQAQEILPTPQPSTITYYSSLKSTEKADIVQIRLGKLLFSSNNNGRPSKDVFNEFFKTGITQPITFKTDAEDGVEIFFQDEQGISYFSDENSGLPQDFELTNLDEDEDDEGEYMKFVARFNVSLYSNLDAGDPLLVDTINIQNAVYEGYFQR